MDEDADIPQKINKLLGAVAALKAYIAHLPGAADVDLEAVRRAGRDTGAGLIGGVHPSRTSTTPWRTSNAWLRRSNLRQTDSHDFRGPAPLKNFWNADNDFIMAAKLDRIPKPS